LNYQLTLSHSVWIENMRQKSDLKSIINSTFSLVILKWKRRKAKGNRFTCHPSSVVHRYREIFSLSFSLILWFRVTNDLFLFFSIYFNESRPTLREYKPRRKESEKYRNTDREIRKKKAKVNRVYFVIIVVILAVTSSQLDISQ